MSIGFSFEVEHPRTHTHTYIYIYKGPQLDSIIFLEGSHKLSFLYSRLIYRSSRICNTRPFQAEFCGTLKAWGIWQVAPTPNHLK